MPVIISLLIVIGVAAVCVAAFFGVRAYRHHKLARQLDQRSDDQVHYVFVINPSKPQADQRKRHIREFCEAKGLTQVDSSTRSSTRTAVSAHSRPWIAVPTW